MARHTQAIHGYQATHGWPGPTAGPEHGSSEYMVLVGVFGANRGSTDGLAVFGTSRGPRPSTDDPPRADPLPCIVKATS